jgi:hypothetical protein
MANNRYLKGLDALITHRLQDFYKQESPDIGASNNVTYQLRFLVSTSCSFLRDFGRTVFTEATH